MSRPIKEGLDYFPHDTDAFTDEKIEILRYKHGAMGYMFYFFHLERIYRSPNSELDISDAETRQILARKLSVTEEEYNQILSTCIKYNCFNSLLYADKMILTSNGIKKRASQVIEKRNKMRELYIKRISDAETREETRQSKVKESKVKESKVKESKVKESKVKESIKNPNPEVKIFIDYAFESFKLKFKEKLCVDGKKDGMIAKKLLNTYGLEKLKGFWDVFIQSDDAFIRTAGFSIGVFKSQINKLISQTAGGDTRETSKTAKNWALADRMIEKVRAEKEDRKAKDIIDIEPQKGGSS